MNNTIWYLCFILFLAGGIWLLITADSFLYRILALIGIFTSLIAISYQLHKQGGVK